MLFLLMQPTILFARFTINSWHFIITKKDFHRIFISWNHSLVNTTFANNWINFYIFYFDLLRNNLIVYIFKKTKSFSNVIIILSIICIKDFTFENIFKSNNKNSWYSINIIKLENAICFFHLVSMHAQYKAPFVRKFIGDYSDFTISNTITNLSERQNFFLIIEIIKWSLFPTIFA